MTDSNEGTPIITSTEKTKIKDPKRVEAGKRLAAISKAAKERKMREKVVSEKEDDGISYGYIIGTIGVVIAAGSLYYAMKQNQQMVTVNEEPKNVVIKKNPSHNLDSFD